MSDTCLFERSFGRLSVTEIHDQENQRKEDIVVNEQVDEQVNEQVNEPGEGEAPPRVSCVQSVVMQLDSPATDALNVFDFQTFQTPQTLLTKPLPEQTQSDDSVEPELEPESANLDEQPTELSTADPSKTHFDLLKHYQMVHLLNPSIFGQIYCMKRLVDDQSVVIKISNRKLYHSKLSINQVSVMEDPKKECEMLRKLRDCPRVVQLLDEHEDANFHYLVMEHLPEGDLFDVLNQPMFQTKLNQRRDPKLLNYLQAVFHRVVLAVQDLHRRNVAHLDLSLENVLMWNKYRDIKLCDFGVAQRVPDATMPYLIFSGHKPGKQNYMAPELLQDIIASESTKKRTKEQKTNQNKRNKRNERNERNDQIHQNNQANQANQVNQETTTTTPQKSKIFRSCSDQTCHSSHLSQASDSSDSFALTNFPSNRVQASLSSFPKKELRAFHAFKLDMFNLGVMLFILLTGHPPFLMAVPHDERYRLISEGQLVSLLQMLGHLKYVSSEACHLLTGLLATESKRISHVDDILNHGFFKTPLSKQIYYE